MCLIYIAFRIYICKYIELQFVFIYIYIYNDIAIIKLVMKYPYSHYLFCRLFKCEGNPFEAGAPGYMYVR